MNIYGFTIICDKCGSNKIGIDIDEYYAFGTGDSDYPDGNEITFICKNCNNQFMFLT